MVDKDDPTNFFFYLGKFCSANGRSNNMTLFFFLRTTLVWPLCESLIGLLCGTPSRVLPVRRIDLLEVNL